MDNGIIIAVAGLATTVVAYVFGRGKAAAETKKTELDAVEKAITIWRQLAEDLSAKVTALQVEVDKLREENNKLNVEIDKLRELVKHERY